MRRMGKVIRIKEEKRLSCNDNSKETTGLLQSDKNGVMCSRDAAFTHQLAFEP